MPGRPKKLTSREEKLIVRNFNNGKCETTTDGVNLVSETLQKTVSNSLIRNKLYENNMKSYKKQQAPLISKKNLRARKIFYEKYKNFTYEEWQKVIFSDESTFKIINAKGRQHFYSLKNNKQKNKVFVRTVKFGGGSLMIWGFISFKGRRKIYKVDGMMNQHKYVDLLHENFLDDALECGVKLSDVIFQQDNAPCHKTKKVLKWFSDQNINVIEWPPQSPDLNPIENLWNFLDSLVRKRQSEIKNKEDLWRILYEEWNNIPEKYIKNLYKSMPKRLNDLAKAKFDCIKY